jgi:hypothetical protein
VHCCVPTTLELKMNYQEVRNHDYFLPALFATQ